MTYSCNGLRGWGIEGLRGWGVEGLGGWGIYLCLLLVFSAACGPPPTNSDGSEPDLRAGPAVCADGPDRPRGTVDSQVAGIGPTSNAIRRGGDDLWIVESGSNTVSRLSPQTGAIDQPFIDVGNGHNPYDIAVAPEDDRAYITNYLANSITVADTETGEVLAEITDDRFANPSGIAVAGDRLYVTNIAFSDGEFQTGKIAIVDRETREVAAVFDSQWKNPQFARRVETPDGPRVAITDTGAIERGDRAGPSSPAGLELWKPDADLDAPARAAYKLGVDRASYVGAPGRALPTPDGRFLYFTSATAPAVFKFDLVERSWVRGASNPIDLYETDSNALHHGAMGPNGLLFVTAFNRDALYIVDTTCDKRLAGPVTVGTSEELLEGPHDIAIGESVEGVAAYFIFSTANANAVGRIRLREQAPGGGT